MAGHLSRSYIRWLLLFINVHLNENGAAVVEYYLIIEHTVLFDIPHLMIDDIKFISANRLKTLTIFFFKSKFGIPLFTPKNCHTN